MMNRAREIVLRCDGVINANRVIISKIKDCVTAAEAIEVLREYEKMVRRRRMRYIKKGGG